MKKLSWLTATIFVLVTFAGLAGTASPQRQICLTFEKLPYMEPLGFWTPREVSNLALRTMESHEIQAVGFVVDEKIDAVPPSYIVLDDWVRAGHKLGNNTYGYVDLNELSSRDFLRHVGDGQKYLRRVFHGKNDAYRFFRYPLLHQGDTSSKKEDVAGTLRNAGYQIVPATVLTSDYQFNHFFHDTFHDPAKQDRLKELFIGHIVQSLEYSEKQSDRVFGKQITHLLQLHLGIATATFLEDLILLLGKRGYEIVGLEEALSDPLYQVEENYVGPLGLSFIDRVAASKELPFDADIGKISRGAIREAIGAEK